MSSTGAKYPTANNGGTAGSGGTFSSLTAAYSDDGTLANLLSTTKNTSHTVYYYNFAMGIPTGATINSVTLGVEWKS